MTDRLYPHVRKAGTKTRLDIAQWPGLDKITYEFLVVGTGEAIAGPFMFGRAFDAPPFFTYSAVAQGSHQGTPELTIGVSEWIVDEQGLWIGANLWIRFRVCHEPHLRGTSTFGAGFEEVLAKTGGGPEGDELPRRFPRGSTFGTIFVWHSTINIELPSGDFIGGFGEEVAIDNYMDPYHYTWTGPTGTDPSGGEHHLTALRISTANPNGGLYHVRTTAIADPLPAGFRQMSTLWTGAFLKCREGNKESSSHNSPVWRINPGDKVTMDWDAMVSTLTGQSGNGGPWTLPDLFIANENLNEVARFKAGLDPEWELTTSYQSYHAELVAPDEAFYVIAIISTSADRHGPNIPEAYFDIDNLDVVISGTNESAIGPSIEVRLNFEGQTLKGYNNIHEIPPRSAPTKVVLS